MEVSNDLVFTCLSLYGYYSRLYVYNMKGMHYIIHCTVPVCFTIILIKKRNGSIYSSTTLTIFYETSITNMMS